MTGQIFVTLQHDVYTEEYDQSDVAIRFPNLLTVLHL